MFHNYNCSEMEDNVHYFHHIPRPYVPAYPHRSPFVLNRPYLEEADYVDYYRENFQKAPLDEYEKKTYQAENAFFYLKIMAYAQIFIGGVLLVSDVSRIVLLWNFVQFHGSRIEMVSQLSYPLFSLVLGFLSLTAVLAPSPALSKLLAVLLIAASLPNFVLPKQAIFLTTAVEAMEVGRATDRSLWKDTSSQLSQGMIRSEAHNRLARMLSTSVAPGQKWPLGVQDLTSMPIDFLVMMQYLLVSYSLFSFLQIVIYIITLFVLIRILGDQ